MKRLAVGVLAALVLSVSFTGNTFAWHENIPFGAWFEIAGYKTEAERTALEIKALLKSFYYKDIDENDCTVKILQGDRDKWCLDRNSGIIKKEDIQLRQEEMRGKFGGAGIEISMQENNIVAKVVREDGPAYKAGIRNGDVLLEVDGKTLKGATLADTVRLIRGKIGTEVSIKVLRDGTEEIFKFLREQIKIEFLKSSFLYSNVGYMKLLVFEGDETQKEFYLALENFEKAMSNEKNKSLIVDIRDNPGGLLVMVENMLALFTKNPDDILITEVFKNNIKSSDKAGEIVEPHLIGRFKEFRVVVLVNGRSASASEIFAGKMKELGYAVVGEKTFGKGTVQTEFGLSDGSIMHLTIAEYFVGNGEIKVDGVGVEPNFAVSGAGDPKSSAEILHEDRQLQKAIELLRK